jgi:hypothetical protein
MSLLRHYARASGHPQLLTAVAAILQTSWDPHEQIRAPDGSCEPRAHAATILGMLATGGDTTAVSGYLRRAEDAALGAARSSREDRSTLSHQIWRMMQDTAIAGSRPVTDHEADT